MESFEELESPKIPNWKIYVMGLVLTAVGVLIWVLI